MIRLNFFVIVGAGMFVFGLFITGVELLTSGLVSSAGVFGETLPSVLLVVLGIVLIRVGTRPKRFSRRK
jgi:hypothetical protein